MKTEKGQSQPSVTLTCEGQLGLMDTLLRLYLAEDAGLKTVIPSLRQIYKINISNLLKPV